MSFPTRACKESANEGRLVSLESHFKAEHNLLAFQEAENA